MSAAVAQDEDIDRARVEALSAALWQSIARHYRDGPPSQERVFEALNAIAFVVAPIVIGAGSNRDEVSRWLHSAIDQNVARLAAHQATRRVVS